MKKVIFLLLILLLSGCNYKEIDKIAITIGCGLKKTEKGYQVTLQIADTQKQDSSNSSTSPVRFKNYSYEDKTIHEAARGILTKLPKKAYTNHMQILVIDEQIAKEEINEIIDFFFREVELRNVFYVFISKKNSPEEILGVLTQIYPINSVGIRNLLKNNNKYLSGSVLTTFEELVDEYISDTKEIILPIITVIGDEGDKKENLDSSIPKSLLYLNETAIFKENKLSHYLTKDETIYYNLITNKLNQTILSYECEENKYITLEIIENKSKIKIEQNTPNININIKAKANLTSSMCNYDISKESGIKEIEDKAKKEIEQNINNLINKTKEYQTDIFLFKDLYYKYNNKYYNNISDYNEFYKKIKIKTNIELNIFEKGNSLQVIENEKNK